MALSRSTIFFIVATIPILFAAVQPWIWFFYTVCIFAAFFLVFLQKQEEETWIKRRRYS
jgi:cell division protein FtsW (lipid II flippase)